MTIKEKDFRLSAQARPEIVELADRLLELGGVRDDESFSYVRAGLIYRNQAFRECLLTHRVTEQSLVKCRDENKPYKDTYATYQMPNGKVYKVAVDIGLECAIKETLRICPFDLDEHVGIPCETDYNSLQAGDTFVSSRGLVAVIKGVVTKGSLHKFFDEEVFYNVYFDGCHNVLTPSGIQNLIKYR